MTAFVFALQCVGTRRVAFDTVDEGLAGLRASDRTKRMAWALARTAFPGAHSAAQTSTSTSTSTC